MGIFGRLAAAANMRHVLFLVLFLRFLTLQAYAGEWVVTNSDDAGEGSLRWAAANAQNGDTVKFSDSLDGQTIILSGEIPFDKDISFIISDGKTVKIDGDGAGRAMNLSDSGRSVSFSGGIVLTNGEVSDKGGGIHAEGVISSFAAEVSGNKVTKSVTSGTNYESVYGGGIYAEKGIESFSGTVKNNTAEMLSQNVNNSSTYGGGVYVSRNLGSFTGEITGNTAFAQLLSPSVTYASAYASGGGLYCESINILGILGGILSGNSAISYSESNSSSYGGGAYAHSVNSVSGIISGNTALSSSENSASASVSVYSYGGGLYAERIGVISGSISQNIAKASGAGAANLQVQGGGVYIGGYGIDSLTGKVTGNSAYALSSSTVPMANSYSASVYGGGVYAHRLANLSGEISGNSAEAEIKLTRSVAGYNPTVSANVSGGGMYAYNIGSLNGIISGNNAKAHSYVTNFSVESAISSQAEIRGGAVYGENIVVLSGDIFDNSAYAYASLTSDTSTNSYVSRVASANITGGTVNANNITYLSGNIYGNKAEAYTDSFEDSYAEILGGVVYAEKLSLFSGSVFDNEIIAKVNSGGRYSYASVTGGIAYAGGEFVYDFSGNIFGNTLSAENAYGGASLDGGIIYSHQMMSASGNIYDNKLSVSALSAQMSGAIVRSYFISDYSGSIYANELTLNAQGDVDFHGLLYVDMLSNFRGNIYGNTVNVTGGTSFHMEGIAGICSPGLGSILFDGKSFGNRAVIKGGVSPASDASFFGVGLYAGIGASLRGLFAGNTMDIDINADSLYAGGAGAAIRYNIANINSTMTGNKITVKNSGAISQVYGGALFLDYMQTAAKVTGGTYSGNSVSVTGRSGGEVYAGGGAFFVDVSGESGELILNPEESNIFFRDNTVTINGITEKNDIAFGYMKNYGSLNSDAVLTVKGDTNMVYLTGGVTSSLDSGFNFYFRKQGETALHWGGKNYFENSDRADIMFGQGLTYIRNDFTLRVGDLTLLNLNMNSGHKMAFNASGRGDLAVFDFSGADTASAITIESGTVIAAPRSFEVFDGKILFVNAYDVSLFSWQDIELENSRLLSMSFDDSVSDQLWLNINWDPYNGKGANAPKAAAALEDWLDNTSYGTNVTADGFNELVNNVDSATHESFVSNALDALTGQNIIARTALNYAFDEINFTKEKGIKLWSGYIGYWNSQNSKGGYSGYESSQNGLAAGGSYEFTDITLGAYYGKTSGSNEFKNVSAKTESDASHAGIYGRFNKEESAFVLSADIAYSQITNDTQRNTGVFNMTGSFDQSVYGLGVEAGYSLTVKEISVLPFAGLRYNYMEQDGFKENGGMALEVEGVTGNMILAGAGVRGAKSFEAAQGIRVTPQAVLAVYNNFGDNSLSSNAKFAGQSVSFEASSVEQSRLSGLAGIGINASFGSLKIFDIGINALYNMQFRSGSTEQSVFGGVELKF